MGMEIPNGNDNFQVEFGNGNGKKCGGQKKPFFSMGFSKRLWKSHGNPKPTPIQYSYVLDGNHHGMVPVVFTDVVGPGIVG